MPAIMGRAVPSASTPVTASITTGGIVGTLTGAALAATVAIAAAGTEAQKARIAELIDGSTIAALNAKGLLHLWHAPSWEEIDRAERKPNTR